MALPCHECRMDIGNQREPLPAELADPRRGRRSEPRERPPPTGAEPNAALCLTVRCRPRVIADVSEGVCGPRRSPSPLSVEGRSEDRCDDSARVRCPALPAGARARVCPETHARVTRPPTEYAESPTREDVRCILLHG